MLYDDLCRLVEDESKAERQVLLLASLDPAKNSACDVRVAVTGPGCVDEDTVVDDCDRSDSGDSCAGMIALEPPTCVPRHWNDIEKRHGIPPSCAVSSREVTEWLKEVLVGNEGILQGGRSSESSVKKRCSKLPASILRSAVAEFLAMEDDVLDVVSRMMVILKPSSAARLKEVLEDAMKDEEEREKEKERMQIEDQLERCPRIAKPGASRHRRTGSGLGAGIMDYDDIASGGIQALSGPNQNIFASNVSLQSNMSIDSVNAVPSIAASRWHSDGVDSAEDVLKRIEETEVLYDAKVTEWQREFTRLVGRARLDDDNELATIQLGNFVSDFTRAATMYARVIISEKGLHYRLKSIRPALSQGGVAGGSKYIAGGIFFKFAMDSDGVYGGSDFLAAKGARHDLRSLSLIFEQNSGNLNIPLTCVVEYKSVSVLCQALVQGVAGSETLVYGSCDGGYTVHDEDPTARELMTKLGRVLNLKSHKVSDTTMAVCGDAEVHRCPDGQYYLLDVARLMPPQPIEDSATSGGTAYGPARGSAPSSGRYSGTMAMVLTRQLRPELVKRWKKPLCSDAYTMFDSDESARKRHKKEIENCYNSMLTDSIPYFVDEVIRTLGEDVSANLESVHLTDRMHAAGINVRHLLVVYQHMTPPSWRALCMAEMVARAIKEHLYCLFDTLNQKIGQSMALERPFVKLFIVYVNSIANPDNPLGNFLWAQTEALAWIKFRSGGAQDDDGVFDRMRDKLHWGYMLRRLLSICGMESRTGSLEAILSRNTLPDNIDATELLHEGVIDGLQPRIHAMSIINITVGIKLFRQARMYTGNSLMECEERLRYLNKAEAALRSCASAAIGWNALYLPQVHLHTCIALVDQMALSGKNNTVEATLATVQVLLAQALSGIDEFLVGSRNEGLAKTSTPRNPDTITSDRASSQNKSAESTCSEQLLFGGVNPCDYIPTHLWMELCSLIFSCTVQVHYLLTMRGGGLVPQSESSQMFPQDRMELLAAYAPSRAMLQRGTSDSLSILAEESESAARSSTVASCVDMTYSQDALSHQSVDDTPHPPPTPISTSAIPELSQKKYLLRRALSSFLVTESEMWGYSGGKGNFPFVESVQNLWNLSIEMCRDSPLLGTVALSRLALLLLSKAPSSEECLFPLQFASMGTFVRAMWQTGKQGYILALQGRVRPRGGKADGLEVEASMLFSRIGHAEEWAVAFADLIFPLSFLGSVSLQELNRMSVTFGQKWPSRASLPCVVALVSRTLFYLIMEEWKKANAAMSALRALPTNDSSPASSKYHSHCVMVLEMLFGFIPNSAGGGVISSACDPLTAISVIEEFSAVHSKLLRPLWWPVLLRLYRLTASHYDCSKVRIILSKITSDTDEATEAGPSFRARGAVDLVTENSSSAVLPDAGVFAYDTGVEMMVCSLKEVSDIVRLRFVEVMDVQYSSSSALQNGRLDPIIENAMEILSKTIAMTGRWVEETRTRGVWAAEARLSTLLVHALNMGVIAIDGTLAVVEVKCKRDLNEAEILAGWRTLSALLKAIAATPEAYAGAKDDKHKSKRMAADNEAIIAALAHDGPPIDRLGAVASCVDRVVTRLRARVELIVNAVGQESEYETSCSGSTVIIESHPETRDPDIARIFAMATELTSRFSAVGPLGRVGSCSAVFMDQAGTVDALIRMAPRGLQVQTFLEVALAVVRQVGAQYHALNMVHGAITPIVMVMGTEDLIKGLVVNPDVGSDPFICKDQATVPDRSVLPYASPERIRLLCGSDDHIRIGFESDIYSLGVCFFEMLTAQPLFSKTMGLTQLNKAHQSQRLRIGAMRPDLPPAVIKVIEACLQPLPENRYHTSYALYKDLERISRLCADLGADHSRSGQTTFEPELGGYGYPEWGNVVWYPVEQRQMDDCLSKFLSGNDTEMVLLTGPTGIGKGRLLDTVFAEYEDSPNVLYVHGKFHGDLMSNPSIAITSAVVSALRKSRHIIGRIMSVASEQLKILDPSFISMNENYGRLSPTPGSTERKGLKIGRETAMLHVLRALSDNNVDILLRMDDVDVAAEGAVDSLLRLMLDGALRIMLVLSSSKDVPAMLVQTILGAVGGEKCLSINLDPQNADQIAKALAVAFNMVRQDESLDEATTLPPRALQNLNDFANVFVAMTKGLPHDVEEVAIQFYREKQITFNFDKGEFMWPPPKAMVMETVAAGANEMVRSLVNCSQPEVVKILSVLSHVKCAMDLELLGEVLTMDVYEVERHVKDAIQDGLATKDETSGEIRLAHGRVQNILLSMSDSKDALVSDEASGIMASLNVAVSHVLSGVDVVNALLTACRTAVSDNENDSGDEQSSGPTRTSSEGQSDISLCRDLLGNMNHNIVKKMGIPVLFLLADCPEGVIDSTVKLSTFVAVTNYVAKTALDSNNVESASRAVRCMLGIVYGYFANESEEVSMKDGEAALFPENPLVVDGDLNAELAHDDNTEDSIERARASHLLRKLVWATRMWREFGDSSMELLIMLLKVEIASRNETMAKEVCQFALTKCPDIDRAVEVNMIYCDLLTKSGRFLDAIRAGVEFGNMALSLDLSMEPPVELVKELVAKVRVRLTRVLLERDPEGPQSSILGDFSPLGHLPHLIDPDGMALVRMKSMASILTNALVTNNVGLFAICASRIALAALSSGICGPALSGLAAYLVIQPTLEDDYSVSKPLWSGLEDLVSDKSIPVLLKTPFHGDAILFLSLSSHLVPVKANAQIEMADMGYRAAQSVNLHSSAYHGMTSGWLMIFLSMPLRDTVDATHRLMIMGDGHNNDLADLVCRANAYGAALMLAGERDTSQEASLMAQIESYVEQNIYTMAALAAVLTGLVMPLTILGEYEVAYDMIYDNIIEVEDELVETNWMYQVHHEYVFFSCLVAAQMYTSVTDDDSKEAFLAWFERGAAMVEQWGECSRINYESKAMLVAGERQRIKGEYRDALRYYEKCRDSSMDAMCLYVAMISAERTADCYEKMELNEAAHSSLAVALRLALAWGSRAKVAGIEERKRSLADEHLHRSLSFLKVMDPSAGMNEESQDKPFARRNSTNATLGSMFTVNENMASVGSPMSSAGGPGGHTHSTRQVSLTSMGGSFRSLMM